MSESVYVLMQVKVKDREKLMAYVQGHLPSFRQYGGELVLRGERMDSLLESRQPELVVVHRWPSEAAYRRWEASPEYRPWRELRTEACEIAATVLRAL